MPNAYLRSHAVDRLEAALDRPSMSDHILHRVSAGLAPLPIAGGDGSADAPPAAPPAAPAAAPPAAPVQPQSVTVPYDQFQAFLANERLVAEQLAREKAREAEAQRLQIEADIRKGEAAKAIETIRGQHQKDMDAERAEKIAITEKSKKFVRDKELATAAAGLDFNGPHAARQFLSIVGPQLEAYAEGDSFAVRTADFRTPEQLLTAARDDPQYAHFFLPRTKGGVKPSNSHQSAPTPAAPVDAVGAERYRSMKFDDLIMEQWRQNQIESPQPLGFRRVAVPKPANN